MVEIKKKKNHPETRQPKCDAMLSFSTSAGKKVAPLSIGDKRRANTGYD